MLAAGTADGMKLRDFVTKHPNMIHYALYEGRCLDPKRLSYFYSERTIDEGNLTEEEIRKKNWPRRSVSCIRVYSIYSCGMKNFLANLFLAPDEREYSPLFKTLRALNCAI